MAKEDDVEEVRVGWVLQEKPENIIKYQKGIVTVKHRNLVITDASFPFY